MFSREELHKAFTEIDVDNSGAIDIKELTHLVSKVNLDGVDMMQIETLFKEIDINNDNSLSFEEFVAWYRLGRNSNLRNALKFQLSTMNKLVNHYNKNYTSACTMPNQGRTKMIEVDIRDGQPSEDNHDFLLRFTSKADKELADMVKRACPNLKTDA